MNKQKKTNKGMVAAAVAFVAGTTMLAGGGAAYATTMSSDPATDAAMHTQNAAHGQSQAATDLRVTMNNLLRQHVTSNINVNRAIIDGNERMINAATESEYLNSDDLSAAVGSIYGGEAQAQFSTLFREHLVESNAYAMAAMQGDQAAKDAAIVELQDYLHDLSDFFSAAIPGLPAQDVYNLLNLHEELVNKATNAYQAGDYVQSYQMEREALKQVSTIADALSSGIVATQPAKF